MSKLIEMFQQQKLELEERNRWAQKLDQELAQAGAVVRQLQGEMEAQAGGYEAKVSQLEEESERKTAWGVEMEQRLTKELVAKCEELAKCVEALHETEKTLDERTTWAFGLQKQVRDVEYQLALVRASRWIKLGNAFGIGPPLSKE